MTLSNFYNAVSNNLLKFHFQVLVILVTNSTPKLPDAAPVRFNYDAHNKVQVDQPCCLIAFYR